MKDEKRKRRGKSSERQKIWEGSGKMARKERKLGRQRIGEKRGR